MPGSALAHAHYAPRCLETRELRDVPLQSHLGTTRGTDSRLPNVLAGNGLGDGRPHCTRRHHLFSKLGLTTTVCIPLLNVLAIGTIGDLSRVTKGLSVLTLRIRELERVCGQIMNKRAKRRRGYGTTLQK